VFVIASPNLPPMEGRHFFKSIHPMNEKRKAPRHRVLKAGTISFDGAGISCTVRNLSDTGASLEVVSLLGIPTEFNLIIESDHIARRCRVVWRKERRIGVTFEG